MARKLIKPGEYDAEDCAKLVYMAGPRVFAYLFGLDQADVLQVLTEVYHGPATPYARETMVAAADGNTILGLMLAYPVRDARTLEWNFIRWLMRKNCKLGLRYLYRGSRMLYVPRLGKNELFIGYLAVSPAYRGRGIAAELLSRAEEDAKKYNLPRISLFVETDNHRAMLVYRKSGFRETERKMLPERLRKFGLTGFAKMVKDVTHTDSVP
jgi:ribosomal protein S18 acetylase RimI-like enzyme